MTTHHNKLCARTFLSLQLAGAELEHRTSQLQKVREANLGSDVLLDVFEAARKNALSSYDRAVRNYEAQRC